MGIQLTENDLSELEPQISKIFRKQLGFFDSDILSTTMKIILNGTEKTSLEQSMMSLMEAKKAKRAAEEVWTIVSEFYIMKEESIGAMVPDDIPTVPRQKRRHRYEEEEEGYEYSEKRMRGDGDGDTWDRAERYNKGELDKVQQIPKKVKAVAGGDTSNENKPSQAEIQKLMANVQRSIAEKKKQLNLPPTPSAPANLTQKAQQLAALQASIASKLQNLPKGPVPLIINESGRTVDSSGAEIQLTAHIPTLKANIKNLTKKEEFKVVKPEPEPVKKEEGPTFIDPRVSQRGAIRSRRVMQFHDAGKFQDEARRLRMKATLEKLQSEISSKSRKTGISSATQLAKLVPKSGQSSKVPDIEWWDQLLIQSHDYENWEVRPGAISNLIEHPIQLKPMESSRTVHVPMFLTKKERKKLRRQNRREAWKEKQDKIRLGLVAPDEPKVKLSNLMRVLGNEAVMDPTKVEAQVRAQVAKRKADHENANASRKLTPAQKKAKNCRKIQEDTSAGVHVAVYRVKNLMNPAKKWKLEKNASQLFMSGTVVLYQDINIVVVEGGPKQLKKYRQLMLRRIKWSEDTYTDKDGTEHNNKAELVWEGQTKQRSFSDLKFKLCPTEGFAREHFKKAGCEHYWDHAYSTAVIASSDE